MKDIAVKVEGLSKRYRIGLKEESHDTLGGAIVSWVKSPVTNFKRLRSLNRFNGNGDREDVIWALKDVSFEVKSGEVIGVIGRNGAGKSTLLKILSRITEPTHGRVTLNGRVASLLEVGTGFHPDLTGRENVYLNGTILGMSKREVERKFDEIVAFSGVEKFIDTPIKRYSSGMKVRLAFSVAAHLEPEILIVDEVLAVGDAEFQKKCLGKMEDVARSGRTVLFVSHNMLAVQSLCNKVILMEGGTIAFEGPTEQATMRYLDSLEQLSNTPLALRTDRVGGETFRFTGVEFIDPRSGLARKALTSGQPVVIRIHYACNADSGIGDVGVGITFCLAAGTHLFACRSRAAGVTLHARPGEGYTECLLPRWPLKAGRYSYHLYAEKGGVALDHVTDAGALDVETSDYYGSGHLPAPGQPGVLVDYSWQQQHEPVGIQAGYRS